MAASFLYSEMIAVWSVDPVKARLHDHERQRLARVLELQEVHGRGEGKVACGPHAGDYNRRQSSSPGLR